MWQMINFKKLVGVLNEIEEQAVLLEIPITSIDKINDVYIDITFDDMNIAKKMYETCLRKGMDVDRDESRNSFLVRFTYDSIKGF